ncbi:chromosome segregation protein SMC [Planctomicrobium piriforme]|uniref:Chromosome partition protein Smc n=1 Tax=Planctomicrobium piriforme TaxID=1576369 RepID=A0A1I3LDW9_9PLAN|nr:chromosome segregation protein SMC [Planctomicrobium piriforme]SFI82666.1 condensin subunit Smc [Planctomicrobium piriforme]
MLKSLELFGFKSFADRTVFEFAPGITCVVGPNGSGKSNVVDAIKWILGDQSAKSLRGQEMSDVIFNGSSGRKGSGFAEATLSFDNTTGLLPIDAAEVQIGRRLYQSGDSEYLLNGSAVRLKDIRDVFMGTGAGTAAYSIIEQGRVDQILQPNPAARRLVFEEAAGISKFKSRRVDAERRLERVAQNLLRLTDIVDQAESQLNATRSQATKAAKYQELSTELRSAWTGLAADDCRVLTVELDKEVAELGDLDTRIAALQGDFDRIDTEKRGTERRLAELDQQLQTRERSLSSLRESIARHEATIRHQSVRREEMAADQHRIGQQRIGLGRQADLARQELAATNGQLSTFEEQLQESQKQVAVREQQLHELEEIVRQRKSEIEAQRRELLIQQKQRNQMAERLSILQSQAESIAQNQQQAQERRDRLQSELDAALLERTAREEHLREAETALQTRQELLTDAEQAHWKTVRQREETEQLLQTQRERRSAAEARLAVLEELEQRQEGIAIGVREILKRAETAHFPPWDRIIGTVRDLLDVPMDLAPIIDAALGDRSQLIAVTDLAPLLDYLNRGAAPIEGRVGFVSIAPLIASVADDDLPLRSFDLAIPDVDYTGQPGVFGRADLLVQARDRAQGLATRVLGDTWIVENLTVARRLLLQAPPTLRIVTLQGEVLTANQHLFVGMMPHETSIVSRKSELRQLKNEIQQLHRSIEAATQRQAILAEALGSRTEVRQKLSEELKRLSNAVTGSSTQLAGQVREVQRLERECSAQSETLAAMQRREEENRRERDHLQSQLTTADGTITELKTALTADEESIAEVQSLLQETQQAIRIEQLDFAMQEERLRGLRQTQTRLERDQKQRLQQLDEAVARAVEIADARQRGDLECLRAQNQVAERMLEREQIQREARGLYEERAGLRQSRAVIVKEEEAVHSQRRQLVDRKHALEFEVQKQKLQLTTLAERIQEEFQVSLEQLVESGVSAYQAHLAERYGVKADSANEDESVSEDAELNADEEVVPDDAPVPTFAEVRAELDAHVERLRRKLKMLGSVNTDALTNLQELERRHATVAGQLKDLQEAKAALEDIIRKINHESQRIFLDTFETIRGHFKELFRKLFGGGDADIILENPDDVLECGIDIVARPPGKELRSISLLSGGEKTMTAVGMLFAMFKSKPSPYCILDEVDAALDEANVDRYVAVVKEFVKMTQFVIITHRKPTMTAANVLYGVTMEQAGVSKRIAVRFEDVRENGEIRTAA